MRARTAALASAALLAASSIAHGAELDDFFGTWLGYAEIRADDGSGQIREMDIQIVPDGNGFRIGWVNNELVDGRRDRPGVVRRTTRALFRPSNVTGVFREVGAYNPFEQRGPVEPLEGDPVRWAAIEGDTLRVYSFVVLPDGRYELQLYDRTLMGDDRLAVQFERVVDGDVARQITGQAAKAIVDPP